MSLNGSTRIATCGSRNSPTGTRTGIASRRRRNNVDVHSDDRQSMKNTQPSAVTLPSDREIVITRSFDAPRALVFEAWTRPEHVAQWWDPSGAPLAACEIDLRPNGAFRFVNQSQ